ncbi:MAG TPA: porin, partial [Burkholderiaceae bacterium]|nr:porin [Burkholderiaceae bacterium]
SAYQLNAVYATGPFAVQAGFEKFKDAFSLSNSAAGAGTTISATAGDTKAYMVSAKYTWENTTGRLGYEREEISNPSDPTQDQQVTAIFGQTLSAPATVNKFVSNEVLNVYWIGGTQQFTNAFGLSIGVYHVAQNAFSCTTGAQSGCSGATNYYSLMGDYNLSKRTDAYLGIMNVIASGGPANADHNTTGPSENTNRTIALGIRHRF